MKIIISVILILVISAGIMTAGAHSTLAQSSQAGWSYPVKIHESEDDIAEPVLVADQTGVLHLFWSIFPRGGEDAILYMRYDGNNWTLPTDIITRANISSPSAAVDPGGIIHLVWTEGAQLYYSQAPAATAFSAQAWAEPLYLGDSNPHASITSDADGRIMIVYPAIDASGPVFISSEDGGVTWSDDVSISLTAAANTSADNTRLAIGNGTFHVAWTEFLLPNGWPPVGLYYSKSTDDGKNWSKPYQLAGENYNQVNIIANNDGEVFAVWNGIAGTGGRYSRWSTDEGGNWANTTLVAIPPTGGSDGLPQLAFDSTLRLHSLFGYGQCPNYSEWELQTWSNPYCIAQGVITTDYSEEPAMAIVAGNTLHAVFWDGRKALYYSNRITAAPPIAFQEFQSTKETVASTQDLLPETQLTETPAPNLLVSFVEDNTTIAMNPIWPVLLAVLPVFLLILGILLFRLYRSNRSRD